MLGFKFLIAVSMPLSPTSSCVVNVASMLWLTSFNWCSTSITAAQPIRQSKAFPKKILCASSYLHVTAGHMKLPTDI